MKQISHMLKTLLIYEKIKWEVPINSTLTPWPRVRSENWRLASFKKCDLEESLVENTSMIKSSSSRGRMENRWLNFRGNPEKGEKDSPGFPLNSEEITCRKPFSMLFVGIVSFKFRISFFIACLFRERRYPKSNFKRSTKRTDDRSSKLSVSTERCPSVRRLFLHWIRMRVEIMSIDKTLISYNVIITW